MSKRTFSSPFANIFFLCGRITADCPFAANRAAAPPTIDRAIVPGLYPRAMSGPPRVAAAFAALSTLFNTGDFLPNVHSKCTVIPVFAWVESSCFHKSEFSLGSPCRYLQSFFFHSLARFRLSLTYCESVKTCTRVTLSHGAFSRIHLSTRIQASSSILLLLLSSHPKSTICSSSRDGRAAQEHRRPRRTRNAPRGSRPIRR